MQVWILALVNLIRKSFFNPFLFLPGMEHKALIKKENTLGWILFWIIIFLLVLLTIKL